MIVVGTEVSTVGRCLSITSNIRSGVDRSGKRTVAAPAAKGKIRFVPVA